MRLLSLTILILSFGSNTSGQKNLHSHRGSAIDFYKEDISLTVSDSNATVNGIYWFRNPTELQTPYPVSFPFYMDSLTLFPEIISAYIKNDSIIAKVPIQMFRSSKSIAIRVPMTAKGTTVWHLDYSQKILSHHARYILTSTAAWGKPLEEAIYRFIVPKSFDSVRVWPKADSISAAGDQKIYWSHKSNFMPARDMEINWQTK